MVWCGGVVGLGREVVLRFLGTGLEWEETVVEERMVSTENKIY